MAEPDPHLRVDAEVLAEEHAWLRLPIDRIGLLLGPAVLLAWLLLVPAGPLRPEAHRLAGIMLLTVIWWVTEPILIPATGLLAVMLCVLFGVGSADAVLLPFADKSVFFMIGGLFIGRAMARHRAGFHRCSRHLARAAPGPPAGLVAIFGSIVSLFCRPRSRCNRSVKRRAAEENAPPRFDGISFAN
jgi:di/tricarboxylate transporter